MIDLSLSTNQLIIAIVIAVYIVIISIAVNKYHQHLESIKKNEAKFKLQLTPITEAKNSIKFELQQIKNLKRKSYIFIILVGFLHLLICLGMDLSLSSFYIPFLLFAFILIVNYWLKGSSVSSFIKNIPGQSDYHG